MRNDDLPGSLEEWHTLEQACFDEGLLTHGFGKLPRITKKGQELVKLMAIADEDVREGLDDALRQRWVERRAAFVTVLELAVISRNAAISRNSSS